MSWTVSLKIKGISVADGPDLVGSAAYIFRQNRISWLKIVFWGGC